MRIGQALLFRMMAVAINPDCGSRFFSRLWKSLLFQIVEIALIPDCGRRCYSRLWPSLRVLAVVISYKIRASVTISNRNDYLSLE
jgi:hypothetical protein